MTNTNPNVAYRLAFASVFNLRVCFCCAGGNQRRHVTRIRCHRQTRITEEAITCVTNRIVAPCAAVQCLSPEEVHRQERDDVILKDTMHL